MCDKASLGIGLCASNRCCSFAPAAAFLSCILPCTAIPCFPCAQIPRLTTTSTTSTTTWRSERSKSCTACSLARSAMLRSRGFDFAKCNCVDCADCAAAALARAEGEDGLGLEASAFAKRMQERPPFRSWQYDYVFF